MIDERLNLVFNGLKDRYNKCEIFFKECGFQTTPTTKQITRRRSIVKAEKKADVVSKPFWVNPTKKATITDASKEAKSICENDNAKEGRSSSNKTSP